MCNDTPNEGRSADSVDNAEKYIEIWKTTIETQKHFNEMAVKSRQLGLTFVAAVFGLAVVLLSRDEEYLFSFEVSDLRISVHIAALLVFGSIFSLYAVKTLDLGVYHQMLRGSVAFGEDFEQNYMKKIFHLNKGLTQAISFFSRNAQAQTVDCHGKYQYASGAGTTAGFKLARFYNFALISIAIIAVLLTIATGSIEPVRS